MGQLGKGHSEEFLRKRREQEQKAKEKRRKMMIAAGAAAVLLAFTGTIAGVSAAVSSGNAKKQTESASAAASALQTETTAAQTTGKDASDVTQTAAAETGQETTTIQPETETAEETTSAEKAEETSEETTAETTQQAAVSDGSKVVYLTFDDGPSELTEPLLDMLDQCGVKATFFDVGIRIEKYPDLAAETVSRGHAVGLHSYDHDYGNVYSSLESFADSTFKAQAALQSATGVTSYLYRFPGGSSNLVHQKFGTLSMTACADWLTQNGFTYDDWNVSSGDANETPYTADEIADMVIDGVGDMNTAVVLMHNIEGKESTIEALPKIVETLTAKGYTFGTLQAGGVTVHHHAAD